MSERPLPRGAISEVLDKGPDGRYLVLWEVGEETWEPRDEVHKKAPGLLARFTELRRLYNPNDASSHPVSVSAEPRRRSQLRSKEDLYGPATPSPPPLKKKRKAPQKTRKARLSDEHQLPHSTVGDGEEGELERLRRELEEERERSRRLEAQSKQPKLAMCKVCANTFSSPSATSTLPSSTSPAAKPSSSPVGPPPKAPGAPLPSESLEALDAAALRLRCKRTEQLLAAERVSCKVLRERVRVPEAEKLLLKEQTKVIQELKASLGAERRKASEAVKLCSAIVASTELAKDK